MKTLDFYPVDNGKFLKVSERRADVVTNAPFHRLTGMSPKDGGEGPEEEPSEVRRQVV